MGWLDGLRDRSIFYSFDRSGYRRHQRDFTLTDLDRKLTGKICLVTGANAGLGRALASGLAARRAEVYLLCRSPERGAEARDAIARTGGRGFVLGAGCVIDTRTPAGNLHAVRRATEAAVL